MKLILCAFALAGLLAVMGFSWGVVLTPIVALLMLLAIFLVAVLIVVLVSK